MNKKAERVALIAGGLLAGLAGGFFGGGGGMLAVPLFDKVLKQETKTAHATAMLVILPMSIVAAITYYSKGIFELGDTLITGVGVLSGGIVGALLLKKLNSFIVSIIFVLTMIAAGIKLTFF